MLADALMQDDDSTMKPPALTSTTRLLTAAEFHKLADVPPEEEWFARKIEAFFDDPSRLTFRPELYL